MKTCRRFLDFVQIINAQGDVRLCCWVKANAVGNLIEDDLVTILNNSNAHRLRESIADGSFRYCAKDNCPYLSNGNVNEILADYDEDNIGYPQELYLGYEGNCNYNCTCCTSWKHMKDTRNHNYSQEYDVLEKRIMKYLPYIKKIGANGRGELFASPRILNILANWNPIAPPNEVSVSLETNGSLFNEKNWKKIENLGKYNLRVAITIMSFDELTYQYLSGTNLPISNLIENLKFVKQLRETGVINELELATVMQELNFREMPDFVKRCIEEFGADSVRIRPIMPGGILNKQMQWFADIRNPLHPSYSIYKKMMENPIFKNEKVLLWSGDIDSNKRSVPLENEMSIEELKKHHDMFMIITSLLKINDLEKVVKEIAKGEKIAIFGIGAIGKVLVNSLGSLVVNIYDNYSYEKNYKGINIYSINRINEFSGTVIITLYGQYKLIKDEIVRQGFKGNCVSVEDLLKYEAD